MILELLPEVQRLSAEEKRALAEELMKETDESLAIEVAPDVIALLDHRIGEHEANPVVAA